MKKGTAPKRKKVNWLLPVVVCTLVLALIATAYGWKSSQEQKAVRELTIEDQDLSSIHDGVYEGKFSYGSFTYRVSVTVESYTIKGIEIIENRTSKYAKLAEGVVDKVLAKGNVNVDVVAGASTTSKALLKAIEQALASNI